MRIRSVVAALAMPLAISALTTCSSPTPPDLPGTFFALSSTPTDWVGRGRTVRYDSSEAQWTVDYRCVHPPEICHLYANVWSPVDGGWTLNLSGPSFQPVAEGNYPNAQRYPFMSPSRPGLSFWSDGFGCMTDSGHFTIHRLRETQERQITRLHVTFVQHCEDSQRDSVVAELMYMAEP